MILSFSFLLLGAALIVLIVAAVRDAKDRVIPDHLVLAVFCLGVVLRSVVPGGLTWQTLVVGALVFLPMSFLSARNIMGGGDAKMITAISFLFPPERILLPLVMIALAGGVLSIAYLAAQYFRACVRTPAAIGPSGQSLSNEASRVTAHTTLPFGVAIFAGVALSIILEVLPCLSETSFSTSCSL